MSLNKVILIGNVGKDPDVKYFDNGNARANFSVATSDRGYKLADGTEIPERTEWHSVVANRNLAQFVEKYVKKGSLVYVEGKLRTRNYDDAGGVKHYITEIFADRVEFFSTGRRQQDGNGNDNSTNTNAANATPSPTTDTPPASSSENADDLPF